MVVAKKDEQKPIMTAKICKFNYAPKKTNEVLKLVRKKSVYDAKKQLFRCPRKKMSVVIEKMIHSAMSNIEAKGEKSVYISEAYVGLGSILKRMRIHGRGQTGVMLKRTSNVYLKFSLEAPKIKKKVKDKVKGKKDGSES